MKPTPEILSALPLDDQELLMIEWFVKDLFIPKEAAAPLFFSLASESIDRGESFSHLLNSEKKIMDDFLTMDHAVSVWLSIHLLDIIERGRVPVFVNRIRLMAEAKLDDKAYAAFILYMASSGILVSLTKSVVAGYERWMLNEDFVEEFKEKMSQPENAKMISMAREHSGAAKILAKSIHTQVDREHRFKLLDNHFLAPLKDRLEE